MLIKRKLSLNLLVCHFNKLESPSSKDVLYPVSSKLTLWFWRRGDINFVNEFLLFFTYLPLEKGWVLHFNKRGSPFFQGCFLPSFVEIGPVVLKMRIYKFCQCIFAILYLSPLGKELNPSFYQLVPPSLKDEMSIVWLNWVSGFGEEDVLISSRYFHYFVIISPWKKAGPLIWTYFNPLYARMPCAKFGWN